MTQPMLTPAQLAARELLAEVREAREELATAEVRLSAAEAMQDRGRAWMHRDSMKVRVMVAGRAHAVELWRTEVARAEAEASRLGLGSYL